MTRCLLNLLLFVLWSHRVRFNLRVTTLLASRKGEDPWESQLGVLVLVFYIQNDTSLSRSELAKA